MDMREAIDTYVNDVVEVPCHISRTKNDIGIDVKLRININASVAAIVNAALPNVRIRWQNSVGRKHIDAFTNGQTIDVDFMKPTEFTLSREQKVKLLAIQLIKAGVGETDAVELASKLVDNGMTTPFIPSELR